jgi:tetratricopeptide (TPR) repeat protein
VETRSQRPKPPPPQRATPVAPPVAAILQVPAAATSTPLPRTSQAPLLEVPAHATESLRRTQPGTHVELAKEMLAVFERELAGHPKPHRAGRLHYECARLHEWPLADTQRAADHYQKAHGLVLDHLPSVRGARRTLLAAKRHAQALPFFDAEIRLTADPQRKAVVYYEKGLVLEDALNQKPQAREAFEAGLELDPTNPSLLKAVERAEIAAKAWDSLEKTYARAANAVTQDQRLKAALIAERARVVEGRKRDTRTATELYRLALETDPRTTGAIHALKRLCFAEERFGDLVSVLAHEAELVSGPEARSLSFYRAGRVLSDRLGALDKAADAFESAAREAPKDRLVLEELARAHELAKRWPELVAVLERLAELATSPAEKVGLLHQIGELAEERLGDEDVAIAWFERARDVDPLYLPAIQALSKLYTRRENWTALLAVHGGEADRGLDTARRAAAHARMAEILEHRLNQLEGAAEHHARALGMVPGYAPSFKALERLLLQAHKHEALVELYERAVDLAPDAESKITWLFKIGRLEEDVLGEPARAMTAFRRILDVDAQHLGAIHALQRAAERAGRFKELIHALELEVPRVPDKRRRLELLHRAGEVAELDLGDEAQALAFYRKAFELEHGYLPALAGLGRLHYKAGRWDALLETYRAELENTPSGPGSAALHYKVGELYEQRIGREDEALAAYRRALMADPRHRPSIRALERKLGERGRWDDLSRLLEGEVAAAAEIADKARAAFRVGEIYENRLKQTEKARGAYEQALAADPEFRPAREGLIRLLTLARDFKRVAQELEHQAKTEQDPALAVSALLRQGEVCRDELGDVARAVVCFEAVLERDPAHVEALTALEPLYVEQAATDALARLYATEARVLSDAGARVAVLRELARLEERRAGDDLARVREAEMTVLQLAPSDPTALAALERLALRAADPSLIGQVDAQLANAEHPGIAAEHTTRLAELLEASGDASALGLYRAALAREADNIGAARGLARMAERLSDPKLLEEAASRMVAVGLDRPYAARLLLRAAEVQANARDQTGAASLLEAALEVSPENELAAQRLELVLVAAGEVDRAVRILSQAATEASDRERAAKLWIRVAELHAERRHDLQAALAVLHRALAILPAHVDVLLKLAELFVRDGQWTEAVDHLRQVTSQPSAPQAARLDAHARLAAILDERLGDPDRARASVEAVLAANPKHAAALGRLVQLELRRGRLDAASEAASRLVQISEEPEDRVEALAAQGRVEKARGRLGAAGQAFAEAIAIGGLESDAATELVELVSQVPRKPDAPTWDVYAGALERYVESAGEGAPAGVFLELSRVYREFLRRPDQAIQVLERGASQSEDAELHAELAGRMLEAGNPAKAIQALRRVLERDVTNALAWRKLSECFKALGRRTEATLAVAPLAALGQANDLELATLSHSPARPASAPPRSFDLAELESISLVPPGDPAARLVGALSEVLEKVYPPELERYGLSPRDRLGARSTHAFRALADRIAAIFGVTEFELYLHQAPAVAVEVEFTDPVSILVPPFVQKLRESAQVFLLGRVFAQVARRIHPVERLGADALELLLAAAARIVEPSFPAPVRAGENSVAALSKRVSRALPWLGRGSIEDAARAYASSPSVDFNDWALRARLSAARAAVLVADDLPAAVLVTRQTEGDLSGAQGAALAFGTRQSRDLLSFWLSDGALAVRRRLGVL